MGIVIQVAGSLLILCGFALAQFGVLEVKSRIYLIVNTVGSAILAVDAWLGQQWGFLLLEGVWAIVSGIGLIAALSGRRPASKAPQ
ncbi:hypothetical protein E6C64_06440 [Naasia lichenicola]|uniref:CBU-0592-like domain-containing protein n=2 Tax=Naasia lichenicola TaxID=2565933 RepID=A0A4S4FRI0_9MICO|nr:hypothetical protein E6C64_06440 [Naasia lichenicola]